MTTVTFRYTNRSVRPMIIQVEPWAGVYRLVSGQTLELLALSDTNAPEFDIDEDGDTRYITILHSTDYYVVFEGNRVHWTELPNSGCV